MVYPLVMTDIAIENHWFFMGKIHYFNGHSYVKLPEGRFGDKPWKEPQYVGKCSKFHISYANQTSTFRKLHFLAIDLIPADCGRIDPPIPQTNKCDWQFVSHGSIFQSSNSTTWNSNPLNFPLLCLTMGGYVHSCPMILSHSSFIFHADFINTTVSFMDFTLDFQPTDPQILPPPLP